MKEMQSLNGLIVDLRLRHQSFDSREEVITDSNFIKENSRSDFLLHFQLINPDFLIVLCKFGNNTSKLINGLCDKMTHPSGTYH